MINVTKAYLPDIDQYYQLIKRAWDKSWLTNNGELVQELESRLKEFLGVKHLYFCSNGTIALQIAIKALGIKGEVITTPFSYVATTNALLWEGCTPVFVDIDPDTFCIDPDKIEASINSETTAILATHVYGYPCNIEKIELIARKYKLKLIYDGAHAFGSQFSGRSLLSFGDITTCSFHATKLFHTAEGGCIITNNDETAEQIRLIRQFGHHYDEYHRPGINGKNSELHAAMGLCILDDLDKILEDRKRATQSYSSLLEGTQLTRKLVGLTSFEYNYAYYPVLFESEEQLLNAVQRLNNDKIYPRRYFYPSLNTLPFINYTRCSVSEDIASRVLCLPLFYGIDESDINRICRHLKMSL